MKVDFSRPLVIHKGSLLVGAALATVILLSLGATQTLPSIPRFLRVQLDPHPSTVVRVVEGAPYTVPAGTMLSIRVLGWNDVSGFAGTGSPLVLKINGTAVLGANPNSTYDVGFPVVAPAGAIVTIEETYPTPSDAFALGYLTSL